MNQFVFETTRPVVETKQGKLRGVTYGDVNIFMGAPYAQAKRFQMPKEIEPWDGIKDAYKHGPIAMQILEPNNFNYYRGLHMLEVQSEDCQNLNIWAPKTLNGEKKPVFVWIHGGGFFGGNAFEEYSFDGFNLAHYGDIVFVSINHRLNVLAHLNMEEYGEQFRNSGNAGIADLVMAMKWIHENIGAFGGDPDNVTICGHSGGGGKVQALFQIEEAAPYFQKGICLSGARLASVYPEETEEHSRLVAKNMMDELGITKGNIDKIYDVSYDDLVAACKKVANPFFWAPVKNEYFPGFPADVGLMPWSKDKPIMYGSTLGETPTIHLSAEEKEAMSQEEKITFLKDRFGKEGERLIELFEKAYPDHDILDLACVDSGHRIAAEASANAHIKAGTKDVYLFMASYCAPEEGHIPIWHGGEVAYILMNEDKVLVLNEALYGQKYGQILSTMVLNFVKNGDPNNKYLPLWSAVTEEDNYTMIIDKECRVEAHYDDELIELYDKVAPKFVLELKTK